jgi:hypothetical protein
MIKHEPIDPGELASVSGETLSQLLRQVDILLAHTLEASIAADQRATTLAGIFGGASIAVVAAFATLQPAVRTPALTGAVAALALLLFVSAMLAAWASRPSKFHFPGYEPRRLLETVQASPAGEAEWVRRYIVIEFQRRIDANRCLLDKSGRKVSVAVWLAIVALPSACLAYAVISFFPACPPW